ncbi:hypothetical protein [Streptomyces viridosporus]|uniref:Uncharacterized protein n=2 Tax=Streptomyces TaxID=1883 RepID=A0ABX6AGQ4_STRVD|nr:hypothetical protein [Streptomyces viridosporus]QEU87027.1 hypothetical protein CP969_21880 [Streptomyces viridosporus T7A]
MAFGVEELRVLRRALALALHPATASADDVQDCRRLADSLDEATRESARLRAFLVADLGRYRAALPGTAAGYLTLLEEVLGAGYRPRPDDLAALRALRGNPTAAALLHRCRLLAEQDVRARLARRTATVPADFAAPAPLPTVPASRTRLLALPGGLAAATEGPRKEPAQRPAAPRPRPAPAPDAPKPTRPIPTPGEVFPRRKPSPPPSGRRLAAG